MEKLDFQKKLIDNQHASLIRNSIAGSCLFVCDRLSTQNSELQPV
ncbi:hypothetical protein VCHA29O37_350040 [Vibrio chagasii]|nr:hypothetical protein VCHA29O37_350040 [Vibrio chagasii]